MSRYEEVSAKFRRRAQATGNPIPERFTLLGELPDATEIDSDAGLMGTWEGGHRPAPPWAVIPTWTVETGVTIEVRHVIDRPATLDEAMRLTRHIQEVIDEAMGAHGASLSDAE
jgi:hypothetical protein